MDERGTGELIETLGDDVDKAYAALDASFEAGKEEDGSVPASVYEFYARQFIRATLAYIEGVTFSVKVASVKRCRDSGIEVTDFERYLAIEVDGNLNDRGEVVERSAKLRLAQNVRFAFRLFEKASGQPLPFDPSDEWWSCLKNTIRVRDRLTHPRMPEDIDVSANEILDALKAKTGFEMVVSAPYLKDA